MLGSSSEGEGAAADSWRRRFLAEIDGGVVCETGVVWRRWTLGVGV